MAATFSIGNVGERRFGELGLDAELHAERPGGDIVGRFGGRAGRTPDFGIGLLFEQVLGVAREHLVERDDEGSGRIRLVVLLEALLGAEDFDAGDQELVHQFDGFVGIVLRVGGDEDGEGLVLILAEFALLAGLDGVAIDAVDLVEQVLAAVGGGFEQRVGGDQFVIDDVAQGPAAAQPGARIFGARGDVARRRERIVGTLEGAAALGFEIAGAAGGTGGGAASAGGGRGCGGGARGVGLQLHDGSGDARAGDFGEQAHLVVPPSGPRHGALPEVGVGGVEDDAGLAFGFQRGGLRLAEDAVEAIDQRVHVGIDGVGGRHGEDARTAGALLVFVEPDGGEPLVPQDLGGHLAFLLAEEVHVAIVIVAGVVVIEVRQRAGFAGRAEGLVVPVGDHDLAIGIERRHQQEDDVVEDLLDGGGIAGGEVVDQFQHHLRRADFGGVDVVGDEDDGLAGAEDLVALGVGGGAALEVELAFQVLQLVEIAQVFGGTDFQQDEGIAVGGGAEIAELDAVRAATACMYSTILSQRTSFLSLPMRKPKYSSGVWTAAWSAAANRMARSRRFITLSFAGGN